MSVLATIGYDGAALEEFLAALKAARVSRLIDIREAPVSRRPGFSKRDLQNALERAGIAYLHLRGLGNPKPGRDAAKAGDTETYRRIFLLHMTSDDARTDLAKAAAYARQGGACLLCYERDHRRCHRDIVSGLVAQGTDVTLRHLKVSSVLAAEQP